MKFVYDIGFFSVLLR